MNAIILIENTTKSELVPEWGLSAYIEHGKKKFLLDTGSSGKFARNADKMGVTLEEVDFGVLSHAHYDHGDGMADFFARNQKARFYLRETANGAYYAKKFFFRKYIGVNREIFEAYGDRIVFVQGDYQLTDGVHLIPHKSGDLRSIGEKANMFLKEDGKWVPDGFTHEQSLVFETEKGLVIFNSCSHGGADLIIREVAESFPGQKVYAMIGGFHLHATPENEVRDLARRLKEIGVERIITGHCTGKKAFQVLHEELGDGVENMYTGMEILL